MPIVTLLTDFGTREPWVGTMKGVILGACPGATVVDLTHEIPPQDVATGALMLADAFDHFPPGTVHVAVVDPGVGSARAGVAVATEAGFLVGPDNGLFSRVLDHHPVRTAVRLDNPRFHLPRVSTTFHGRDVFSPVAAALARGVAIMELGSHHPALVRLPRPRAERRGDVLVGEVLHVDAFGNLLTSIHEQDLAPGRSYRVEVGACVIPALSGTFSDVEEGQPVAYVGSACWLELAVRNGHAGRALGVARGAVVTARPA